MSAIQVIKLFKKEGISVLENIPEQRYATLIKKANDAYYNDNALMTDNEFDKEMKRIINLEKNERFGNK